MTGTESGTRSRRESTTDSLLAVAGGILGGVVTGGFLVHRFLTRARLGDPTSLKQQKTSLKSGAPDGRRNGKEAA